MIDTIINSLEDIKITKHAQTRYVERVLCMQDPDSYLEDICNRYEVGNMIKKSVEKYTGFFIDSRDDEEHETTLYLSQKDIVFVFKGLSLVTVMRTRIYNPSEIETIEKMIDKYRYSEPNIARDYSYLLYGSGVLKGII